MQYTIVPVTPFQQNCSVLVCAQTKRAAIVDPGGDLERVLAAVKKAGATVEKILQTHAHVDHAAATADLAERLSVPIEGPHEDDLFWIESLPEAARMFGFPAARPFTPTRWLHGGDTVQFGDVTLQVKHCPGHTPGHVVFFEASTKLAIVGDVLFAGSIGRTDFPRGDYWTLIESIRREVLPLGDDVTFLPGHGPTSTLGHERRTNPFLVTPERFGPPRGRARAD